MPRAAVCHRFGHPLSVEEVMLDPPGEGEVRVRISACDYASLLVDANSCYTPGRAVEVGRFIEQWGVEHFEEPCPYWELEWTAEVAAALDVGGFTRALAVARMAAAAGLPCVPHSANLSLVTVFAQHLLCAIPNAGPYLELAIEGAEYYPWQYDLFDPPLAVREGRLPAPSGPGWGVEVNPHWLAAAAHRESRF